MWLTRGFPYDYFFLCVESDEVRQESVKWWKFRMGSYIRSGSFFLPKKKKMRSVTFWDVISDFFEMWSVTFWDVISDFLRCDQWLFEMWSVLFWDVISTFEMWSVTFWDVISDFLKCLVWKRIDSIQSVTRMGDGWFGGESSHPDQSDVCCEKNPSFPLEYVCTSTWSLHDHSSCAWCAFLFIWQPNDENIVVEIPPKNVFENPLEFECKKKNKN